jgi:hypothetical protein
VTFIKLLQQLRAIRIVGLDHINIVSFREIRLYNVDLAPAMGAGARWIAVSDDFGNMHGHDQPAGGILG